MRRPAAGYSPGMKTTAVTNQKGGVGKTTDTLHLGGALALHGRRVLLVDLDPQGNLTSGLKVPRLPESGPTLASVMLDGGDARTLVRTIAPGLDIIPASLDLFLLPARLRERAAGETRLRRVLAQLAPDYDHSLIDCRPAVDSDTNAALAASDSVLVPVDVDEWSIEAVTLAMGQIALLMADMDRPPMHYRGMVLNNVKRPFSDFAQAVYDQLHTLSIPVIAEIPVRSKLAEARNAGLPIGLYDPKCDAAQMFADLVVSAGFEAAA